MISGRKLVEIWQIEATNLDQEYGRFDAFMGLFATWTSDGEMFQWVWCGKSTRKSIMISRKLSGHDMFLCVWVVDI